MKLTTQTQYNRQQAKYEETLRALRTFPTCRCRGMQHECRYAVQINRLHDRAHRLVQPLNEYAMVQIRAGGGHLWPKRDEIRVEFPRER